MGRVHGGKGLLVPVQSRVERNLLVHGAASLAVVYDAMCGCEHVLPALPNQGPRALGNLTAGTAREESQPSIAWNFRS